METSSQPTLGIATSVPVTEQDQSMVVGAHFEPGYTLQRFQLNPPIPYPAFKATVSAVLVQQYPDDTRAFGIELDTNNGQDCYLDEVLVALPSGGPNALSRALACIGMTGYAEAQNTH